jgi:hypothetical protein
MKNILKTNSIFSLGINPEKLEKLPIGVYKIEQDPKTGQIYIEHQFEEFTFPHKIYDMDAEFVNRVKLTYNSTTGNLGVLLNGLRGTGKSITAKLISNQLQLPVIIINKNFGDEFIINLKDFIAEMPCDILVLFDEFEKIFPDEGWGKTPALLTLMDGVDNSIFRRLFLMTTNEINLNQNYLERPSRIRYIKTYTDLTLDAIYELIDDLLVKTEYRADCIEFISKLNIITIDIVKAVISEVNIHNESPFKFKDIFNIKEVKSVYDIYDISTGIPALLHNDVETHSISVVLPLAKIRIGHYLSIYGNEYGVVSDVKDESTLVVVNDDDDDETKKGVSRTLFFEKKEKKHRAFNSLAF